MKLEEINNIEVHLNTRLVELKGQDHIESLEFLDLTSNKKFTRADEGAGVFVYAGLTPNTALYPQLTLENGYIPTNDLMETEIKDVYAIGDIRVKNIRQIATAVGDGVIAGINAAK